MFKARIAIVLICAFLILYVAILFSDHSSAQQEEEKKVILIDENAPCISPECHAKMGQKKYIHAIGVDAKKCDRCHEVSEPGKHIFSKLPEKASLLCAKCHDLNSETPRDLIKTPPKIPFSGDNIIWHKPFSEGKCTVCHDAHESDFYRHLKAPYPEEPYAAYSSETYRLCISTDCHPGYEKALENPRTLADTKFRNGNLNLHFKHVKKDKGRTCRTCHRHHGSQEPDLMTDAFKFGTRVLTLVYEHTDTGGSCKTPCHRSGSYDRYEPVFNAINSSPTPGRDATKTELEKSRERDMQSEVPQN